MGLPNISKLYQDSMQSVLTEYVSSSRNRLDFSLVLEDALPLIQDISSVLPDRLEVPGIKPHVGSLVAGYQNSAPQGRDFPAGSKRRRRANTLGNPLQLIETSLVHEKAASHIHRSSPQTVRSSMGRIFDITSSLRVKLDV